MNLVHASTIVVAAVTEVALLLNGKNRKKKTKN